MIVSHTRRTVTSIITSTPQPQHHCTCNCSDDNDASPVVVVVATLSDNIFVYRPCGRRN